MPTPTGSGVQNGRVEARQWTKTTLMPGQQISTASHTNASSASSSAKHVFLADDTRDITAHTGNWVEKTKDTVRHAAHDYSPTDLLEAPTNGMEERLILIGRRRAQAAKQRFENAWRATPRGP